MNIEHVGVRPVLMHTAPGILPVIVDLAAEDMPADTPDMLVFFHLDDVLVAEHHVVYVLRLKRQVVDAGLGSLDAKKHVMIDISLALIAAVERGDDVVFFTGIDFVGTDQAEHFAIPLYLLGGIGRHDHGVGGALDLRRAAREAHQLALAHLHIAGVDEVLAHGQLGQLLHAAHYLHLVAVRVGYAHALAAARLVDVLYARRSGRLGELLELVFVFDIPRQPDELGRAEVGDMDMMVGVGAAHVERVLGTVRAQHAKSGEKLLGLIEAGRLQAAKGQIGNLYIRHCHSSC